MSGQAPTTDQIRERIDSGATGEKVGFADPATVPLGTDAEASGNPPTAEERKMEAAAQPVVIQRERANGSYIYLALAVGVGLLVVLAAWIGNA